MSVRVGDVEVALAPRGVARREVGLQTLCYGVSMEGIHVGDVEDHATPPRPGAIRRWGNEVEGTGPDRKTGKRSGLSSVVHGNPNAR